MRQMQYSRERATHRERRREREREFILNSLQTHSLKPILIINEPNFLCPSP